MGLIIRQCLGCLIFMGGAYVVIPNHFHKFIQTRDWRVFEHVNYQFLGIALTVWLGIWNCIFYLFRHKQKSNSFAVSSTRDLARHPYVPKKMKVVTSAILNLNPNNPTGQNTNIGLAASDPQLEEDLTQLSNGWWGNLDLSCFTHINYQNIKLDLTYTSNACTVPVYVLSQDGVWHVEPSTGHFINGDKTLPAPVAILKQQVGVLHQIEATAKIVPVILLMRGTIQDESTVAAYLTQNEIVLAKFDEQVNCQVPTLYHVLQENFAPALTPVDAEELWDELDERGEQEMLRKKQEANYAQEEQNTKNTQDQ